MDLYVLRWYAEQIQRILRSLLKRDLDLVSIIDDFGDLIYREIDYRYICVITICLLSFKCKHFFRGNLSERRRSMPNGLRSCIQISLMCSCLKSTQTYQLVRFSLWNGNWKYAIRHFLIVLPWC